MKIDEAEKKLFSGVSDDIQKLNKKAKKECRQKERAEYARTKGLKEPVRE